MSAASSSDNAGVSVYSIEMVAQITHIAHDRIILYQQHGLIQAVPDAPELSFDEEAVLRLRHIAFLHAEYGLNEAGVRHFSALLDEVERLRQEVRFLRG
jgi:DNA-binding transcriptional MerR regulator